MNLKNNNIYNIKINDTITMTIKKLSETIAIVFFMDDIENNKINIPDNFIVRDNTNNIDLNKFTKQYFALSRTDNYTFRFNNEPVLEMVSQHCWNLTTPVNKKINVI